MSFVKEQILMFPRSLLYGSFMVTATIASMCFFRNLFGQFYYSTATFLPGCIAGLGILFENPKMRKLDMIIFTNLVLEILLNYFSGEGYLRRSPINDTFSFMLCSSTLMYLLRKNTEKKITNVWIFSPLIKTPEGLKEDATNQTWGNILKEAGKFFAGAYAFQTVKMIAKRFGQMIKRPRTVLGIVFNKQSIAFASFFGAYVVVYKAAVAYLNNYYGNQDEHALLAGLLAGTGYYLHPNPAISILAITTVLQIIWSKIRRESTMFGKPAEVAYFSLCVGVMVHFFVIMPTYCPNYIHNMIRTCTSNLANRIFDTFRETLQK